MTAQASRPAAARPAAARPARAHSLTGTSVLAVVALRRDRMLLLIWVYVLIGGIASTTYSFRHLYPAAAQRAALALSANTNPAYLALAGPVYGHSLGALIVWKAGLFCVTGAGLMGIFTVIRHTRGDEEAGRLELVGAGVTGRYAALAASLVVTLGTGVLLAILMTVVQAWFGLPVAGALALGVALGLGAVMFGAVAAVCAQLTSSARAARGMAISVLGLAFLLRAVGDSASGVSWLSWLSPLGWTERIRPYAGQRWWVAVLCAAVAAATAGAAALLAARRDLDAGLLPSRPGRMQAAGWLRDPFTLAWRLQRGALLGWIAGFAVLSVALGVSAKGIGTTLSSPQARALIDRMGGHNGLVNAYFGTELSLVGMLAAGFGVSAALRLRTEEAEQRAELVLAAAVGRIRWAASHLLIGALGIVLLLAVAGLFAGLGDGLRSGDVSSQVPRLLGAALAQAPAAWVVGALAVALFGLLPRFAVTAGWTLLGVAVLLTLLGSALSGAQWLLDLSPFAQVPKLPGGSFTATPLIWLSVLAAALCAVGLAAFRVRDVG